MKTALLAVLLALMLVLARADALDMRGISGDPVPTDGDDDGDDDGGDDATEHYPSSNNPNAFDITPVAVASRAISGHESHPSDGSSEEVEPIFQGVIDSAAAAAPGTTPATTKLFEGAPKSVCGADNRIQIGGTTSYPWRAIVQLDIKYPGSASIWGCTGWFIGPGTIATAGHCVYSAGKGGWASYIDVSPGANGGYKPYGTTRTYNFRSVVGWTSSGNTNYDYGAIILNSGTLGRRVGWFGFANYGSSTLNGMTVNLSGYPCDKPADTQWFHWGPISSVQSRKFRYSIDTYGCQSGSPVWRYVNGNRYGVGVHTNGGCSNKATRIQSNVYSNFLSWKALVP
jgi:V8-like Glu-specific endopeptidase